MVVGDPERVALEDRRVVQLISLGWRSLCLAQTLEQRQAHSLQLRHQLLMGGCFAFPGAFDSVWTYFWCHGGDGGGAFVQVEVLSYISHDCSGAITESPQMTVAIPVLSRYEQLIIYLQNLSQNLRNSFSLLQKQTSTSLLLSKLPQNLKNQPNRVILKSGLFKIVTYQA